MGYAYFQGQEAEALDYYRKLLSLTADAAQRAAIGHLVTELEAVVKKDDKGAVSNAGSVGAVHNAFLASTA